MTIRDISQFIEEYSPLNYQESYDNAGLIIGNPDSEVNGVLLCIDVTEKVIEEAIAKNCNLIISHHPLIFHGLKKLSGNSFVERAIVKAIENRIAIYSAHTNMDVASEGVNKHIANKLGLGDIEYLRPLKDNLLKVITYVPVAYAENVREAMFNAGAGNIGNYDRCSFNSIGEGTFRGNEKSKPFVGEPLKTHTENEVRIETICPRHLLSKVLSALQKAHPYEEPAFDIYALENIYSRAGLGIIGNLDKPINTLEFLQNLKKIFQVPVIKHTILLKDQVQRIAFCGGAGIEVLNDAIKAKADLLITADVKYHQYFEADDHIVIVDIGHYESEQYTKEIFYNILIKKFPNFAIHFSEINTNPVNYL
jgi:dinuclear metal center YbgI/SA1388 family protein